MQQAKARLELLNQTLKQQHSKELEGREEEMEQVKVTLNKKLKSLSQQLEEVHQEKQAAIKVIINKTLSQSSVKQADFQLGTILKWTCVLHRLEEIWNENY